ncbi:hypothetical protein Tco_0486520 [Tanacetum coccineum]
MSTRFGLSPITNTSVVRNTVGRGKEKSQENLNEPVSDASLREFCDKNYNQMLPILAEKMHQEKSATREAEGIQGVSHITAAAETPKAIIRVFAHEERNPLLRGIKTETHTHVREEGCQKARIVQENTGNLNLKSKSQVWMMRTYPNHGYARRLIRSRLASAISIYQKEDICPSHVNRMTKVKNRRSSLNFFWQLQAKEVHQRPRRYPEHKQRERESREGESTEDFLRRFKTESRDVKGAPKVMRISGFMHGIMNPELIKRLHDKILKSVDEMWKITTTFLREEVADGGFKNQQRPEKRQDRFALLTKTPKEILALDKGKFKPPPPMTTPLEKRNASKFCEFHGEVGHTTDECMHLKRQIEEMLKAGKLSHLIKELKQNNGKDQANVVKKGEAVGKDKPLAILMVQTGRKIAKQRIIQTFSPETMISFPPLGEEDGTKGPMVIEAE